MDVTKRPIAHLALADWFEETGANFDSILHVLIWLRRGCPSKGLHLTFWEPVVKHGEKSLVMQLIFEHQDDNACRMFAFPAFFEVYGHHAEEVIEGIKLL